jgi:SAM-dependent methyltransferase
VFSQTSPVSQKYGWDRGKLIDRYFIEQFLAAHRADIRGRVLEVADSDYTMRFGTAVDHSDVLDISADNSRATIIADLQNAVAIQDASFDCFILTQTLQFIYDIRSAVAEAHRILAPGGVVLATFPGVQRVGRSHLHSDYWRLTVASATSVFADSFGSGCTAVVAYGNVATSMGFLRGMAVEELPRRVRDRHDPFFATTLGVRAHKPMLASDGE